MTNESPPSDQASHAAARVLIALTPLPCSVDLRARHHSTIRPSPKRYEKRYEGLSQDFLHGLPRTPSWRSSQKAAWTSLDREELAFRASSPRSLKPWTASRIVCCPHPR